MEVEALINSFAGYFDKHGYITVFFASFLELTPLGWIVPGGAALVIAGFFANGYETSKLINLIIFGTLGSWFAFLFSYALGKSTGMWLVSKLKQQRNAAFAKRLLAKNGAVILTTSMMANMTRFWVAYIAGVDHYSLPRFLKYSFFASAGWTSLMIFIGYFAGYEKSNLQNAIRSVGVIGWIILGVAIYVLQNSIRHEYKHFKEDSPHHDNHK